MIREQTKKANRITYVDFFRAIGIGAMIMGHINFGWHFDHLIHGFHMPMFFFASGFFYKDCENIKQFTTKIESRCRTLLLPYVIFAIFHIVINTIITHEFDDNWIRLLIFNTDGDGLPIAGALWFLTALFFADIFYTVIDLVIGYGVRMHVTICLVGILGIFAGIYLPFKVPFGIDAAFVGMVFLHIARLFRKENRNACVKRILNLNMPIAILLFVIGCILIMINGYVNLRWGKYGIVPVFWVSSVVTTIGIWNICKLLDARINSVFANIPSIYVWILNVGKDSIVYVCLNQLAILISFSIINLLKLPMWPTRTCVFALTLIFLELTRKLMTKTKLKALIGR